jgi:tetratricopeptide (TPR) repeat protein
VQKRNESISPALGAAAVGLALIDVGAAEAKTAPLGDVRLAQSPVPATSGDHYQDGRALLALGDTAGAIAAFRAALIASPQSIDALNGLGVAYDRIGRYDLSRSWYDTALAIDPNAVLVLNNLGYSFYLQGNYAAAIPLLQQVVDSNDAAARQTGQRLLTLISTRMRADAIEGRPASYAQSAPLRRDEALATDQSAVEPDKPSRKSASRPPVTPVDAPQARIEITSSGEQRLVLGGPKPAPELVASLGDAAPLVMVADAWTQKAEARVAARAATEERALAERSRMAAELAQALAEVRFAKAVAAPTLPTGAPLAPAAPLEAPEVPQTAFVGPASGTAPQARRDTVLVHDTTQHDTTKGKATKVETRPGEPARLIGVGGEADVEMPAWLLASRRAPRPPEIAAAHDEPVAETELAFESDDHELNAFAARMRGITPPVEVMVVSREEAVARLEGLLRRLRAA